MHSINGIPASNGIAIAKAYEFVLPDFNYEKRTVEDAEAEVTRIYEALDESRHELEKVKVHAEQKIGREQADIFSAHLLVLEDPELIDPITEKIRRENVMAEVALEETRDLFMEIFKDMDNEYMRERAADIEDVTKRVLSHLLGRRYPDLALIDEEVIVIADDLKPSQTVQLNRNVVKGFVTNVGGHTSHSAIMARSLDIPAVVGTSEITSMAAQNVTIILDGIEGCVIMDPSQEELDAYRRKQEDILAQQKEWAKLIDEPTVTSEGETIQLGGNIGNQEDVAAVLENGGEAVGLYRTEFLYIGRNDLPSEDEQYEAYKSVLEQMDDKPVVVRTFDIGGDKEVGYLDFPKEMNPFLGFRAIRFCLENEHVFRPQLRALLRASVYGNLKIMFPMIATLDEFRQAKSLLLDEKEKLVNEGLEIAGHIEIGIMVEIPATAIMARQFAREADFFSIGTNDMIQYTMAADRMNERVSYLYQPYNPAILHLIDMVVEAAHAEGKWVGICGEMAGDPDAIPILLSLGLDEFSMNASSILPARTQILNLSKERLSAYKDRLLGMQTADEVLNFIKEKQLPRG